VCCSEEEEEEEKEKRKKGKSEILRRCEREWVLVEFGGGRIEDV